MLDALMSRFRDLPDVWGEGALFAFSGMDGETCSASGFVASLGSAPCRLLWHTPTRRLLDIPLPGTETKIATGDVLAARGSGGELVAAFAAWHTLVGIAPDGTAMRLADENGREAELRGRFWVSEDTQAPDAIAGAGRGGRFALAWGRSAEEACARAETGLDADIAATASARLGFLASAPRVADSSRSRLLRKCLSVMKVNTLAPEGAIRRRWSTPDRVPHKDMWLWDSVFHSLAMNAFDPALAWDFLAAVLDAQADDGFIPHQTGIAGNRSDVTQPPLLAWGVWRNYLALRDPDRLREALPALENYLRWNLSHRDRNGNGLLEWRLHENERCRCGESGLDNSPRFDRGRPLDAVDFSALQAQDMACAALIADELGEEKNAASWRTQAEEMAERVHRDLWDEQTGFYFDKGMDGEFERVLAVTGFLPLLLGGLPPGRADRLAAWLADERHFGTPMPVPSVARSEPPWSTDMWRGPSWANLNLLVVEGLLRQGQRQAASHIAERTVETVGRRYEESGAIFEFYDSTDETPPWACDRKGPCPPPYDIRRKVHCIRDYHWTAAITAMFLLGAADSPS